MTDPLILAALDPNVSMLRPEDVLHDLHRVIHDVRAALADTDHAGLVDEILARHGYRIEPPT